LDGFTTATVHGAGRMKTERPAAAAETAWPSAPGSAQEAPLTGAAEIRAA